MWVDFHPRALSRDELEKLIDKLEWTSWKPKGIILHNTAAPTLEQWVESGPQHAARLRNLQSYYARLGWSGGPHWFVSRNWINQFNSPTRRGVHSPSFNSTHFGIEMVGDFSREEFNSGDGAKVRDNSVFLMAVLCKKFGWDPAAVIKLHKEDPRTDHDCPGKKVVKSDIIARVKAELARLGGVQPIMPVEKPLMVLGRHKDIRATEFGGTGDHQASAYGGPAVNGRHFEVSLPYKFAPKDLQNVRVFCNGKSAVGKIRDVGPWNIKDAYVFNSELRPKAEEQFKSRRKAENNRVPSNPAGIDLTPAFFDYFGIPGPQGTRQVDVDWEFTAAPQDKPGQVKVAELTSDPEALPLLDQNMADSGGTDPEDRKIARAGGFLPKLWAGIGGVFASIGGFIYDWRVAIVIVLFFLLIGAIIAWIARDRVKKLVHKLLDKADEELDD